MSKVIVVSTLQTHHVLAAVTRTVNPDDEIDAAEFISNGLLVRRKAPVVTLALPAGAADSNLAHHANMNFPADQLDANLVDAGHNVLRDPFNVCVKIPDEGPPELAAVQTDHQLTVGDLLSNGNLKVTIPLDAFSQEPKIVVWGRVEGAGLESNATAITAEPSTPPANVEVTLNFGPLPVGSKFTAMVFAGSLRPVIQRQQIA